MEHLIGVRWSEAKSRIKGAGLFEAVVWTGDIKDTANAIVYKQFPEALNDLDFPQSIRGGDMLDLHLMQSPSEKILKQNAPGSLKYLLDDDSAYAEIESRLVARPKMRKRADTSNKYLQSDEEIAAEESGSTSSGNWSRAPERRKVGSRSKRVRERPTYNAPKKKRATPKRRVRSTPKPKSEPKPPPKPVVEETNTEDYGDEFE